MIFIRPEPIDADTRLDKSQTNDKSVLDASNNALITNPQDDVKGSPPYFELDIKLSPKEIVHEYNIVKQMLINNSLPIS